jgi:hypothetical protein
MLKESSRPFDNRVGTVLIGPNCGPQKILSGFAEAFNAVARVAAIDKVKLLDHEQRKLALSAQNDKDHAKAKAPKQKELSGPAR